MQLPVEVVRSEILDWWEDERTKIVLTIPDRLPALFYQVDKLVDEMTVKDLLRRAKYQTEQIDPFVTNWIERLYKELTHELDESFRASAREAEGAAKYQNWSYGEMATAGAAIAVSAAPAAGIPFFAGGLTAAGTVVFGLTLPFTGGGLATVAVAAAAGSAVLLAAGPAVRSKAVSKLKSNLKSSMHEEIAKRLLVDTKDGKPASLKQVLFNELQGVALKRLEIAA